MARRIIPIRLRKDPEQVEILLKQIGNDIRFVATAFVDNDKMDMKGWIDNAIADLEELKSWIL